MLYGNMFVWTVDFYLLHKNTSHKKYNVKTSETCKNLTQVKQNYGSMNDSLGTFTVVFWIRDDFLHDKKDIQSANVDQLILNHMP